MMTTNSEYLAGAEETLSKGDLKQASLLYEDFANNVEKKDPRASAHHFGLAARYEKESTERASRLYDRAYRLYIDLGEIEQAADTMMMAATLYQDNSDITSANQQFCKSIKLQCDIIRKTVSKAKTDAFRVDIENSLDKITFCIENFK